MAINTRVQYGALIQSDDLDTNLFGSSSGPRIIKPTVINRVSNSQVELSGGVWQQFDTTETRLVRGELKTSEIVEVSFDRSVIISRYEYKEDSYAAGLQFVATTWDQIEPTDYVHGQILFEGLSQIGVLSSIQLFNYPRSIRKGPRLTITNLLPRQNTTTTLTVTMTAPNVPFISVFNQSAFIPVVVDNLSTTVSLNPSEQTLIYLTSGNENPLTYQLTNILINSSNPNMTFEALQSDSILPIIPVACYATGLTGGIDSFFSVNMFDLQDLFLSEERWVAYQPLIRSALQQEANMDSLLPIGSLVFNSMTTPTPRLAICNGQAITNTKYSRFIAWCNQIGLPWGGTKTAPNLPDLQDLALRMGYKTDNPDGGQDNQKAKAPGAIQSRLVFPRLGFADHSHSHVFSPRIGAGARFSGGSSGPAVEQGYTSTGMTSVVTAPNFNDWRQGGSYWSLNNNLVFSNNDSFPPYITQVPYMRIL